MRRAALLILFFVAVVSIVMMAMRDSEETGGISVDELRRRESQRKADQMAEKTRQQGLDYLAEQGRGQPLPEYLLSGIDAVENVWFVGSEKDQTVGAELPFKPGLLPLPPSTSEPANPNPGFVGAAACQKCHEENYSTFIHTAHHLTSRSATSETIAGSFALGQNVMQTGNENVSFEMIQRGDDSYQRVSFFDWKFDVPFHLIFGSSKLAEAYLYWNDDQLFQMHCNYLTSSDSWINSPGFKDGDAIYVRPVMIGCVDCHVTYVDYTKPQNHYVPSSMILGVSCERCHGPGEPHIEYHEAHPTETESRFMTVPSDLPREAQLDVCGQCHTAEKVPIEGTAFDFRPGDRLSDFYLPLESQEESTNSVHTSNQIARLKLSPCFQQSEMGCVECHNPHQNERGNTQLFSQRCIDCHEPQHCGMSERLGDRLTENCVDCHMPRRATTDLHLETPEGKIFPPLRDHYIRIDEQATEDYLAQLDERNTADSQQNDSAPSDSAPSNSAADEVAPSEE